MAAVSWCTTVAHNDHEPGSSSGVAIIYARQADQVIWLFFFSSRRRHTRFSRDWSSDVCSSDLQVIKVFWRGNPIFVSHRTGKEIEEARNVPLASLPDPQADKDRIKPGHDQWLVVVGICTHLGCIPIAHQGNYDGWFCPCHGSQ